MKERIDSRTKLFDVRIRELKLAMIHFIHHQMVDKKNLTKLN